MKHSYHTNIAGGDVRALCGAEGPGSDDIRKDQIRCDGHFRSIGRVVEISEATKSANLHDFEPKGFYSDIVKTITCPACELLYTERHGEAMKGERRILELLPRMKEAEGPMLDWETLNAISQMI